MTGIMILFGRDEVLAMNCRDMWGINQHIQKPSRRRNEE